MFEPEVFVGEDAITILFGEIPNRNTIYIDVKEDKLFFDGVRLKTTSREFSYNKELLFEKNKGFEKRRIFTFPKGNEKNPFILAIDCGWDGHVFAKFFRRENYLQPRGKPAFVFSYWHSRREGLKKFYDGDLHEPKMVWPVQYKKELLA